MRLLAWCRRRFFGTARSYRLMQPGLNVKLTQRQVLTPGLVQMVGVLALNKLELKEMIAGELAANPVLEEMDESVESLEERSAREGDRERSAEEVALAGERREADPFEEVDFGSYFQEYLDPGFRTGTVGGSSFDDPDRPSFENFLSQPSTLSGHLLWQLGSMTLDEALRTAAELVVGNLNEDGYLTATDEELAAVLSGSPDDVNTVRLIEEARGVVMGLDPVGVGARDLRECLLRQLGAVEVSRPARMMLRDGWGTEAVEVSHSSRQVLRDEWGTQAEGRGTPVTEVTREGIVLQVAEEIVGQHLVLLQRKDMRELVRLCRRPAELVQEAVEAIRRLDPRPGQRYSQADTRLIEPDVAFVKRDGEYVVAMNEEDLPSLRLSRSYRQMLRQKTVDRDVQEYVKERYKSAVQLLRNIEQRKNTIVRTCEAIVRRQVEFLERGVEGLRPMMIKEVAEEIGVHPSTVSRAVSNKYVHTPQGVYELRFFFSEGGNGPEGGDLPLVLLKRKVKKLIEEEDARRPWTDDALAAELQRQGIQVTRRTVAKYREDMQIPSTHQRRQR
jgi:RNA polymerase sigma-54 factor